MKRADIETAPNTSLHSNPNGSCLFIPGKADFELRGPWYSAHIRHVVFTAGYRSVGIEPEL